MNEAEGLYERVLEAAGGSPPTPRPPRSSAAVVLWRGEGDELEVYWLRRGRSLPFMGGWYAFPGGAVDRADVALPLAGMPAHPDPAARTSGLPDQEELPEALDLSAGVAAAALRELFEETGVLLGANLPAAALAELRAECLTRSGAFGDGLRAQGIAPDAGRLTFAGRWLTPPFTPVRFDNRFFLARWRPSDGEPSVLPPESEEGEWVPPLGRSRGSSPGRRWPRLRSSTSCASSPRKGRSAACRASSTRRRRTSGRCAGSSSAWGS